MAKNRSKELNISPDVIKLAEDIAKERGDNLEQLQAQFWSNYVLNNADIVRKLMHQADKPLEHISVNPAVSQRTINN